MFDGIYVYKDTTVTSSNMKILNSHFMGEFSDSENECCAIKLDGLDNELSELTIDCFKKGIYLNGAGNMLTNIHATTVFNPDNELTKEIFENTIGFHIAGTNYLTQCYSDTFCKGFQIDGTGNVSLTNCSTYYYTNTPDSSSIAVCCSDSSPNLSITNCNFKLPTTGTNKYYSFTSYFENNVNAYCNLKLINNYTPYNPSVPENDIAYCLQTNNITGIRPYYDGVNSEGGKYYPLAILKKSNNFYRFTISNEGDLAYDVMLRYGSDNTILKTEKIYSWDRTYDLVIINEYTENGNTFGILAIKPSSNVVAKYSLSNISIHGNNAIYAYKHNSLIPITVNTTQLTETL